MDEQLPMVVWLRGEEDYFGEFSLEADQAMEMLGIKRSRLTQISGKELRVGRKRVDRYVRPVYRPEDVTQYLEWIRPTASHQKSSQVLFSAAENLSERSQELLKAYADGSHNILESVSVAGDQVVARVFDQLQQVSGQMRMLIAGERQRQVDAESEAADKLARVLDAVGQSHSVVERMRAEMGELREIVASMHAMQTYQKQQMLLLQEMVVSLGEVQAPPEKVWRGDRSGAHYVARRDFRAGQESSQEIRRPRAHRRFFGGPGA